MMRITEGPLRDWYGRLMFTTEGEYHRRIRSLVSRAFTPRSVEALRASAADMAAEGVARARQGGDLVAAYSTVATRLMCHLLGVPDADVPVFAAWLDALSPVFLVMTPEQIAEATTAIKELQSHVDELTTRRGKDPGRDLITALLASEADGERLTHDEAVAMIANLLVAGHDTTIAIFDRLERYKPAAAIARFALSPLTSTALPEFNTAIAHLRDVLGDQTYESLARKGETMTTAEMVTYAYDQIDQARVELNAVSK